MITESFIHCPGVGPKTEGRLKGNGFHTWDDCLQRHSDLPFNGKRKERFLYNLLISRSALDNNDIRYFVSHYPTKEQWRILARYHGEATYFDIETTGLSLYDSHISVIVAYHKGELYRFSFRDNLDDFLMLVDESELLVSFNGSCFDIPFIERSFNITAINCPHIDLRWVAYHQGFAGGLKRIEKSLNIKRPGMIDDIDGLEAVILFYRWQNGDHGAWKRLMSYCSADVIATYLVSLQVLKRAGVSLPDIEASVLFKMALL
ncbi:MAG: ribonuclease H-like domain-containing protein [Deltaproteobacteria bacterium]|nr:ribonuclease H-like domain-containing protein [Deltaproteobacteria bacterium]